MTKLMTIGIKDISLFLVTGILIFPDSAYGYVDPGIIASMFQTIYVVVFGVLLVWVTRPYKCLLSVFRKIKSLFTKESDMESR